MLNYLFSCRFYFDFSPTYVGCGLICPHIVNCSVLLGAIISWGFLWPFVTRHAGDWYPADLGSNDFKGLYGYKVLEVLNNLDYASSFETLVDNDSFRFMCYPMNMFVFAFHCLATFKTICVWLRLILILECQNENFSDVSSVFVVVRSLRRNK